jgi:hypothetical protein
MNLGVWRYGVWSARMYGARIILLWFMAVPS